ncbi:biliverdin-producing heme oxygenase [Hymenobacter profundi]|uniref:Biliverdin-producing heme oxygenase n=1 Tax=Hymenobacter profundi TaxID=1982110 RepID=A0ABS6X0M2_9BACT|nr:biliverdin-producing heme oxygenase [Hymenobacter profundi]MBW3129384.1 biliverdin-producing heme oxygenase [Hymenobacter profundi]
MSATAEQPAILSRLRVETRPYHDALEQNTFNQELTAGTVSQATTAHFLRRLYGFLQPYETQLRAHATAFGPEWQLDQRYRAHLILEDLAQTDDASVPALCPTLPPLHTRAQLLGAMYVLEGSTLGGQVIRRQLAKADIPLQAYFTGYAERTGPMWKSFCQLLTAAATAEEQKEIVQSAVLTFQHLHAWISQP